MHFLCSSVSLHKFLTEFWDTYPKKNKIPFKLHEERLCFDDHAKSRQQRNTTQPKDSQVQQIDYINSDWGPCVVFLSKGHVTKMRFAKRRQFEFPNMKTMCIFAEASFIMIVLWFSAGQLQVFRNGKEVLHHDHHRCISGHNRSTRGFGLAESLRSTLSKTPRNFCPEWFLIIGNAPAVCLGPAAPEQVGSGFTDCLLCAVVWWAYCHRRIAWNCASEVELCRTFQRSRARCIQPPATKLWFVSKSPFRH